MDVCCPNSSTYRHGTDVLEVKQGGLGDCWLIGAFACLADFPGHVAWILLNLKAKPWGGGQKCGKY